MSSLLSAHLEQISLCSTSISTLPFPGPKLFANALLSPTHDITSLIRDTEAHERALFHLAPPSALASKTGDFPGAGTTATSAGSGVVSGAGRRGTVYGGTAGGGARGQPKNKAVAAVLGGDLYLRTRSQRDGGGGGGRQRGEIDVEVLLEGAEKLAAVYPTPGVPERITQLRRRHQQLSANISHYEDRVSRNTQELQLMNRTSGYGEEADEEDFGGEDMDAEDAEADGRREVKMTKHDLEREMGEVRELERKRKALEGRVTGFESDLRGLA